VKKKRIQNEFPNINCGTIIKVLPTFLTSSFDMSAFIGVLINPGNIELQRIPYLGNQEKMLHRVISTLNNGDTDTGTLLLKENPPMQCIISFCLIKV